MGYAGYPVASCGISLQIASLVALPTRRHSSESDLKAAGMRKEESFTASSLALDAAYLQPTAVRKTSPASRGGRRRTQIRSHLCQARER